jgi:DNA-binding NarL/FixJ family response regulator
MTTPRYVVASSADATSVLRRLARTGWHTRDGFALAEAAFDVTGQRLVLFGRVADTDTAELAVQAAARGAGVVVIADPGSEVYRAVLADLARIGPVSRDPDEVDSAGPAPVPGDAAPPLLPEQRALLERLANGETIAAAAAAEYLSLRTANRRIAQARESLGVRTTREAVMAYLRQRRPTP